MAAVSFRTRVDLRTRLRSALLLTLAIGIAGGATLAALAGARRTDSAVDRFVEFSRASDGGVSADPALYERIQRLPQVEFSARTVRFGMVRIGRTNRPVANDTLGTVAVDDFGLSRPIVVAGRLPRSDRVDEVVVNASAARNAHIEAGNALRFHAFGPEQAKPILRGTVLDPTGPIVAVRVVGVVRFPADLSAAPATPDVVYTGSDTAIFTPAFMRAYGNRVAELGGVFLAVRLRDDPAAARTFRSDVTRLSAKAHVDLGSDDLDAAAQARHATSVEALALLLFGVLAGIVTLMLIAQAFARQVYLDASEYSTLVAVGMTRKQLVATIALRAALISVVGAVLAIGLAIFASPLMPIGLARQAEVDRGYSVDGLVLLVGAGVIASILTGWTVLVAWRAMRHVGSTGNHIVLGRRNSRVAQALSKAGSPPSATVGTAMAFESGRGARAVPVRTAMASAVIAVAVVAGALTFGANLTRLADHPELQGWTWDVSVGNPHSDDVSKAAIPLLTHNPDIAAFSSIAGSESEPVRVNGRDAMLFGIDPVRGPDLVPYPAGRAPRGTSEIAFGPKTMSDLHVSIGRHVQVSAGGPARSMLVTGRVLLTPSVVNNQVPLGQAAVTSDDALRALHSEAAVNVFLVRFRAGVDRGAALRQIRQDFPGTVLSAVRPPDLENLQRVNHLPALLAGLFALIALLTVGNTLVNSVRRRRRELAVLRTVGFVRRQVGAVIGWQATIVALVAIVIGIPIGAVAGRAAWTLVTDRLGLPADAIVPGTLLCVVALIALAAANLIAVGPSLLATRTPPATILHAE